LYVHLANSRYAIKRPAKLNVIGRFCFSRRRSLLSAQERDEIARETGQEKSRQLLSRNAVHSQSINETAELAEGILLSWKKLLSTNKLLLSFSRPVASLQVFDIFRYTEMRFYIHIHRNIIVKWWHIIVITVWRKGLDNGTTNTNMTIISNNESCDHFSPGNQTH
jgi:hypothetical protein